MKTLLLVTTGLLSANVFAADTLTVYTYSSFTAEWGPGPKIKQAFEKECDCTLNLVPLEDGVAILNRLRLEGNHSKADLVLGLDDALISEAKQSGLFAPHPAKLDGIKVPGGWQDDTFVPYDYGYFAFVYDKDKLKQPPKSLKELVERPDLKVIYQDPRTSTPGQGLMLWMKSVYGDKVPAAWAELAKKTVTVTKGWSEAYGMFL
ncbi:MAG: thiamine ABC transporter substrate binding subunit, partial [Aeromonas veronii]